MANAKERPLAVSEARDDFAEAVNRVAYGGERVIIRRHRKNMAAIVSMKDLELLRKIEDRIDLEAALKARKEPGTISLEEVKRKYGL